VSENSHELPEVRPVTKIEQETYSGTVRIERETYNGTVINYMTRENKPAQTTKEPAEKKHSGSR
jgi:hypothetical protein